MSFGMEKRICAVLAGIALGATLGSSSLAGGAQGYYDYSGGLLRTYNRIRMSKGGGSFSKMIVRNPDGYGLIDCGDDFVMSESSSGVSRVEFHYVNQSLRTILVGDQLSLRNNDANPSLRSAQLDLQLDEAPQLKTPYKPEDLALFDITTGLAGSGETVWLSHRVVVKGMTEMDPRDSREAGFSN